MKTNTQLELVPDFYLADINGDGIDEFIKVNGNDITVCHANFEQTFMFVYSFGLPVQRIITGKFASNNNNNQLFVIQQDGSLSAWSVSPDQKTLWWWFAQPSFIGNDDHCVVGDFDDDGIDDMLVYRPLTGSIKHFIQNNNYINENPGFILGNLEGKDLRNKKIIAGDFGSGKRNCILFINNDTTLIELYAAHNEAANKSTTFWWHWTNTNVLYANHEIIVANIDGKKDGIILRNKQTGIYALYDRQVSNGVLRPVVNVSVGQLPIVPIYGRIIAAKVRGKYNEPGNEKRDDIIMYNSQTKQIIRTDARYDAARSTLTYWWAWTNNVPGGITLNPRSVNWAIVLCKPADDNSEVQPKSFFEDLFKGVGNGSIRDYYGELTSGQVDFGPCDVLGWYTVKYKKCDLTKYDAQGNGIGTVYNRYDNVYLACKDVSERYNVDFRKYSGIIIIFSYHLGDRGALLPVGQVHSMDLKGIRQNYSVILLDSAAWGKLDINKKVTARDAWSHKFVAHEVGHGLGLEHSRDAQGNDYGDWGDIMSAVNTSYYFDTRQFGRSGPGLNAPNLATLNALFSFNMKDYYSFPKSNGHITSEKVQLSPLSSYISVLKVIRVLNSDNTHYTVEYRIPTNWDRGLKKRLLMIHFVDSNKRNSLVGTCEEGQGFQKNEIRISLVETSDINAVIEVSGVHK